MTINKVGPLLLNAVSAVCLIAVNKTLMSALRFQWAVTLCALHFTATSAASSLSSKTLATGKKGRLLATSDALLYTFFSNCSISALNISLHLNSVGTYQIAKLLMLPCTYLLEVAAFGKQISSRPVIAIVLVLLGVGSAVSSDFSATVPGLCAAFIATLSSSAQQVGVAYLGKKYSISSSDLVGEVFFFQALTLLVFGPFLDFYLVNTFFTSWLPAPDSTRRAAYMTMSCSLAVLVNYSQFKCISELSATGFQVLGHVKTVAVLAVGWLLFDTAVTMRMTVGAACALCGMVLYSSGQPKKKKPPSASDDARNAASDSEV